MHRLHDTRRIAIREHLQVDEPVAPLISGTVQYGAHLGNLRSHLTRELAKEVLIGLRILAEPIEHILEHHAARRRARGRVPCRPRRLERVLRDGEPRVLRQLGHDRRTLGCRHLGLGWAAVERIEGRDDLVGENSVGVHELESQIEKNHRWDISCI